MAMAQRHLALPSLLPPLLPPEILRHILATYLDPSSLSMFWQAMCASRYHAYYFFLILEQAIKERLSKIEHPNQEKLAACLPKISSEIENNPFHLMISRTRYLSESLTVLDYSEQIPDVLWCGIMEFKDPMLPDWTSQHARVILQGEEDNSWSLRNLHGWNTCFSSMSIKLVSQTYNFIPIRPRGRILGVSKKDKDTIQEIRLRLASRDQVMTLRFRNDEGFILRIVSPDQAKRRLESFFRGGTNSNNSGFASFPEGLLCCWEYPSEKPLIVTEQLRSMASTLSTYRVPIGD